MPATELTPEQCAGVVMEHIPPVMRLIRLKMRRHGAPDLSIPQFRALAFLSHHPGASLSDVAEHLGVTLPTASTIADRLVRHGLVTRALHPHERRRLTLNLTGRGSQILQQARDATRLCMAGMLADLTPDQLRIIADGVTLLAETLGRASPEKDGHGRSPSPANGSSPTEESK
jgi:DNA-binding MarR family transcriptional regulator